MTGTSRWLTYVMTMEENLRFHFASMKVGMEALLFFAAVACILAGIGMYAVLSAFVNPRRREFGVRMALGATPRDVRTKVLTESALLTCIGSGIGLLLSARMAVLARSAFLTLNPFDASLYAAAVAAMLVTATLSTLAPASAASRMQPMQALRTE